MMEGLKRYSACPRLVCAQNLDAVSALNSHSGERRNPVRRATVKGDFHQPSTPIPANAGIQYATPPPTSIPRTGAY